MQRLLHLDKAELDARGLSHTPFEIAQQPELWLELLPALTDFVARLQDFWSEDRPVVLVGAGTSAFAAQAVASTLQKQGLPRVEAIASTEIILDPAALLPREPFTMISFARSGNSPESNAAFTLASTLQPGIRHIVITCNRDGELARLAREVGEERARLFVLPDKADDRGLAMTSSFTGMVIVGQALGYVDDPQLFAHYVGHLARSAESILQEQSEVISRLAALPFERAVFIGANSHYATALESHLKVQELSNGHVVAKAESLLGIRHGPMTVIDEKTLVCVFLSRDAYVQSYEMDLLRELRAKRLGMTTVVCAPPHSSDGGRPSQLPGAELAQVADVIIPIGCPANEVTTKECSPAARSAPPDHLWVAPTVLVAQMLALMKSVDLGLTPDAPSSDDVISRVVQGVNIYPYSGARGTGGDK